ncbi:unnamed protein product [Allacma fusca]|uniref:Major facilitator superfamily (MFS) profile domain-containing protein n=1 Tax=Allacma fusca TaxID=39272 RepID=A0A8J2NXY8_9HEXA|nr:unnamed protein product [Allacma fusca]
MPSLSYFCSSLKLAKGSSSYSLYVLALLLFAYLLNQLDRYTLAIVAKPLAQELHYGDKACMLLNDSDGSYKEDYFRCSDAALEPTCTELRDINETKICKWDYTGFGFDYQILAGPIFILVYTFADITWCWGFLLVTLFGLGLGQSGCSPFSISLITDYFTSDLRGAALGVHNWGVYTGYSLSYAVGNFITQANIYGQGWRWAFIFAGLPGLFLGILIAVTVREPERKYSSTDPASRGNPSKFAVVIKSFCRPSILLLCLAGSIRNAAGYVWAYNTQAYFEGIGETRTQIGYYMSWVPMIAGSAGVLLGGFISDRVVKRSGIYGRMWVLIGSQLLAAPFAAAILWLPTPWAYLGILPCNIIGEMWVSVTLAVLVELVPEEIKTTAVAVYFFIISNIGGNMPLMVPLIRQVFETYGYPPIDSLRHALLLLFPGEYVIASALFIFSLFVLKRDMNYIRANSNNPQT